MVVKFFLLLMSMPIQEDESQSDAPRILTRNIVELLGAPDCDASARIGVLILRLATGFSTADGLAWLTLQVMRIFLRAV